MYFQDEGNYWKEKAYYFYVLVTILSVELGKKYLQAYSHIKSQRVSNSSFFNFTLPCILAIADWPEVTQS